MNADAFRHLYAYHFAENRNLWDRYIVPLPQAQFVQHVPYSIGSVCKQIVHLMGVDEAWFSDLRGASITAMADPAQFEDRAAIRAYWDRVEQEMRVYLDALRDDMLFEKPIPQGEDKDLRLWQILLHVANHGTDHRAQVLRLLHDFGVETTAQDYIFYVYDHLT